MSLTRTFALVLLPTLTFGAVVLTGSVEPLRAAGRAVPEVSLAGVMVADVVDDSNPDIPRLAFQGTQDSTRLALVVQSTDGSIVGFDRDESTLSSFTDSTGAALRAPDAPFSPFGFFHQILLEGSRLTVEVSGKEAPAPEATWVEARGQLAVHTATDREIHTSERSPFTKDTVVTCGPLTFEVLRSEGSHSGTGRQFEVKTKAPVEHIISWTFVDGDQRYELFRRSSMGFNGMTQLTLECEADVTAGQLELEIWKDPKTVRVPFSVKARVGAVN